MALSIAARDQLQAAADMLRSTWQSNGAVVAPRIGIVLGSGLRLAADDAIRDGAGAISYSDIPGMPVARVPGHAGRLVAGTSRHPSTILMQGRVHLYEGWTTAELTYSVQLMAHLGVKTLILTNAAGGIRSDLSPGDLMLIEDHIALGNMSSLWTELPTGQRSQRMPTLWTPELHQNATNVPSPLTIHRGTYAMMPGPCYETAAEVRMLQTVGADAVGMSTVPEAIVAKQLGMDVLGISCITNAAAGLSATPLSHDEVGQTAGAVQTEFVKWLSAVVDQMEFGAS